MPRSITTPKKVGPATHNGRIHRVEGENMNERSEQAGGNSTSVESIVMRRPELRIGNRRLWVNAVIGALQAELEVIRQDNLASRSAENIDDTRERLACLLDCYTSKLDYRPFTGERKDELKPAEHTFQENAYDPWADLDA